MANKVFQIGKVLEPEHRTFANGNEVITFGLLIGKKSEEHQIFRYETNKQTGENVENSLWSKAVKFKDNSLILTLNYDGVTKDGKYFTIINKIAFIDDAFRDAVNSAFN